jgi:hypothetical protein
MRKTEEIEDCKLQNAKCKLEEGRAWSLLGEVARVVPWRPSSICNLQLSIGNCQFLLLQSLPLREETVT